MVILNLVIVTALIYSTFFLLKKLNDLVMPYILQKMADNVIFALDSLGKEFHNSKTEEMLFEIAYKIDMYATNKNIYLN